MYQDPRRGKHHALGVGLPQKLCDDEQRNPRLSETRGEDSKRVLLDRDLCKLYLIGSFFQAVWFYQRVGDKSFGRTISFLQLIRFLLLIYLQADSFSMKESLATIESFYQAPKRKSRE